MKNSNSLKSRIYTLPAGASLHNLPFNRSVNPAHVTRLAGSLDKYGLLRPIVVVKTDLIDGKTKLYIADAQHTTYACQRLNIPIEVIEVAVATLEELVELIACVNATSKPWILTDYVTSWSTLIPDYRELIEIYKKFDIELSLVASILMGRTNGSSGINSTIKKGKFHITHRTEGIKYMSYITDILKIVPRLSRWENKVFVRSFMEVCRTRDYNHEIFLTNLSHKKEEFLLATQDQEAMTEVLSSCLHSEEVVL